MRYFGGKAKIASKIARFLNNIRVDGQMYVEPFIGSANIAQYIDEPKYCLDNCEDLILLWQDLQKGWKPPNYISEEEYLKLKTDKSSALRAFAGFGCSHSGKFFGGYAKEGKRNFAEDARKSLQKKLVNLKNTKFECKDYRSLSFNNCLIYCDPPYRNTCKDFAVKGFDHDEFWSIMRKWSKNNIVIVSEYKAPDDFLCVLGINTHTCLNDPYGIKIPRIEKLFSSNKL